MDTEKTVGIVHRGRLQRHFELRVANQLGIALVEGRTRLITEPLA